MSTSPDFDAQLRWLYALTRRGIHPGLGPTRRLLKALGRPHRDWHSIHVAGTNGKGSTAAFLAAILRAAGFRVGLYTSPHLVSFSERIRVDGRPIPVSEVQDFLRRTRPLIDAEGATFFETTTALAFWYFRRQAVDWAVVETGLGGRLDSTNVLTPRATVITPIGRDHRELLGATLTKIAGEKAGILKPGIPLFLAPQPPHLQALLIRRARSLPAPCFRLDRRPLRLRALTPSGTRFRYQGVDYATPLLGTHQMENAALALLTVRTLLPEIPVDRLRAGVAATRWPGRLERLIPTRPLYYDVAHNAHGLRRVIQTLQALYPHPPAGVLVLKGDKDLPAVAEAVRGRIQPLILSGYPEGGLLSAGALAAGLGPAAAGSIVEPKLDRALKRLMTAVTPEKPGLIFGSHYIAEPVYRFCQKSFDNGRI